MQPIKRAAKLVAIAAIGLIALAPVARAQGGDSPRDRGLRIIGNLLFGVGGYYFTDGSAMNALGNPKFGGATTLYGKAAHRHNLLVSGGLELAGAGDHWGPFGGGNSFSLTGGSFEVGKERKLMEVAPFVGAGLFWGHIKSERLNLSKDDIVPSAVVGFRFKFHRYAHLSFRYRVTPAIGGIRTDGMSLGVSLFGE